MPTRLRAVLDTNVIISGLINPSGPPGRILRAVRARKVILVTSRPINDEVLEVAARPGLRNKYGLGDHLFDLAYLLWKESEVVTDLPAVRASRDRDDDKFLAAALGGRAHFLVTGDVRDLLTLRQFREVRIVSPAEFLALIRLPLH